MPTVLRKYSNVFLEITDITIKNSASKQMQNRYKFCRNHYVDASCFSQPPVADADNTPNNAMETTDWGQWLIQWIIKAGKRCAFATRPCRFRENTLC